MFVSAELQEVDEDISQEHLACLLIAGLCNSKERLARPKAVKLQGCMNTPKQINCHN